MRHPIYPMSKYRKSRATVSGQALTPRFCPPVAAIAQKFRRIGGEPGLKLLASSISFDFWSFLCHTISWRAVKWGEFVVSRRPRHRGFKGTGTRVPRRRGGNYLVASIRPSHGRTIFIEEHPASRLSGAEIQSFRTAKGLSAVESRLVSKAGQEKGARLLWRL
jgi:hypothetical protein